MYPYTMYRYTMRYMWYVKKIIRSRALPARWLDVWNWNAVSFHTNRFLRTERWIWREITRRYV